MMCFDCEALVFWRRREERRAEEKRGEESRGACQRATAFSLILLISRLCQPENIPALKYPVNIPGGVFSLLLTVADMCTSFCAAVDATFFV